MNNYCTNCGKKLDGEIMCPDCKLGVIDIPKEKKKIKISKKYVLGGIVLILLIYFLYRFICRMNVLNITKNMLSNTNYSKIVITKTEPCKVCAASCDGGCYQYKKVLNCYAYYMDIFIGKNVIKTVASYGIGRGVELDDFNSVYSDYKLKERFIGVELSYDNIVYDEVMTVNMGYDFRDSINVDFIEKLFLAHTNLTVREAGLVVLNFSDEIKINISGFSSSMSIRKDSDANDVLEFKNLMQDNEEGLNLSDDKSYTKMLEEMKQWVNK